MRKLLVATVTFATIAGAVPAFAVGPYDAADTAASSSVNFAPLNRTQSANQAGPQTQPQTQALPPQLAAHQQGQAQQTNPANRNTGGSTRY
jgi:hypothetical protein